MRNSETKNMLLQDYLCSRKKNLGEFALGVMKAYDDIMYELVLSGAYNDKGHRITGTAVAGDIKTLEKLIEFNKITGDYHIKVIDCQREFFFLLAEIRDDLKLR